SEPKVPKEPLPEPAFLCTSKDCVFAASSILQSIDARIDPCADFYRFSCGGFQKSHPISESDKSTSVSALLEDKANAVVKEILQEGELSLENPDDIDLLEKVRSFYSSCLDSSTIQKRGVEPLASLLNERFSLEFPIIIPTFPVGKSIFRKDRLVRVLAESHSIGSSPLFRLQVGPSYTSRERYVPTLLPAGHLGLRIESYKETEVIIAYKAVVAKMLSTVMESTSVFTMKKTFERLADDMVDFETRLASASPS
ncbi:hypothetical protein HDU67_004524, partial [Dinochytrium kinnereticum]